jgi:large subunit ribosomal protein L4
MSSLTVHNADGKAVGKVEFADALLSTRRGGQALQQTVVTIRANQRAGTASTKTKGEVAGSGIKPWRQKGTGNARAGYRQSPVWTGGGVVFGPKPRSYAKDLNRKTAKLALWRALSDKVKSEQLVVLDDVTVSQPKTKVLAGLLKGLKVEKALVVVDQISRELALASRNIPGVEVVTALHLNSLQVVKYPKILISKAALEQVQIRLEVAQEKAS